MHDQPQASKLAKHAFTLWQAGRAEESIPIYEKALKLADPSHYALPDYHGEFAAVLWSLGRHPEALAQFEFALAAELESGKNNLDIAVVVARSFLAEFLIELREPQKALSVIEPSMKEGVPVEWRLRFIRALAFHSLGQYSEARKEAGLALSKVPLGQKREELSRLIEKRFKFDE